MRVRHCLSYVAAPVSSRTTPPEGQALSLVAIYIYIYRQGVVDCLYIYRERETYIYIYIYIYVGVYICGGIYTYICGGIYIYIYYLFSYLLGGEWWASNIYYIHMRHYVHLLSYAVFIFIGIYCRPSCVCVCVCRSLLIGLGDNPNVTTVSLDVSSNELCGQGLPTLLEQVQAVTCLHDLNLSDTQLDPYLVDVITAVAHNKKLRHLKLGKNFGGKAK